MHGSILLVTIPLRPGHTPGDLQFFSFLEVYTLPLVTQKLRQFPTLELLIDLTYVFATVTSFLSIQNKTTRSVHNFYERFPEFIERRIMKV